MPSGSPYGKSGCWRPRGRGRRARLGLRQHHGIESRNDLAELHDDIAQGRDVRGNLLGTHSDAANDRIAGSGSHGGNSRLVFGGSGLPELQKTDLGQVVDGGGVLRAPLGNVRKSTGIALIVDQGLALKLCYEIVSELRIQSVDLSQLLRSGFTAICHKGFSPDRIVPLDVINITITEIYPCGTITTREAVAFITDTVAASVSQWGMAPSHEPSQPDEYSSSRRVEHKIREVAMGVACLAQIDEQNVAAPMVQGLIEALRTEAREHAGATRPPRLPQWAISLLVALSAAFVTAAAAGLVGYGALQQRVTALEAAHPESISAINAKIDMLNSRMEDMQRRLNDFVDGHGLRSTGR